MSKGSKYGTTSGGITGWGFPQDVEIVATVIGDDPVAGEIADRAAGREDDVRWRELD